MYFPARAKRKEKEQLRKQNIIEETTYYVDSDRAAAVVVGSKDIKSDLKVILFSNYMRLWVSENTVLW